MHCIKKFEGCNYDVLNAWKIIRELVYTSKSKENLSFTSLNINNQEIDDPYCTTKAFNEFFCCDADKVQLT